MGMPARRSRYCDIHLSSQDWCIARGRCCRCRCCHLRVQSWACMLRCARCTDRFCNRTLARLPTSSSRPPSGFRSCSSRSTSKWSHRSSSDRRASGSKLPDPGLRRVCSCNVADGRCRAGTHRMAQMALLRVQTGSCLPGAASTSLALRRQICRLSAMNIAIIPAPLHA